MESQRKHCPNREGCKRIVILILACGSSVLLASCGARWVPYAQSDHHLVERVIEKFTLPVSDPVFWVQDQFSLLKRGWRVGAIARNDL